ncbi:MFS transporter [Paenibacillus oenotherae]|uniref:MFS transporter n=1 Tax=Paenibacillus oenotherae TaxID=1435645 RepID=UPI001FEBD935|nr:MFS transporter [Paenibacillus oenotherae]
MSRLIFLASVTYFVVGLGQLAIGAVMEPMVHAYGVQYGDGGQLVMHQFLGGLLGIFSTPWLIKRLNKKLIILLLLGIAAAAEMVYTMLPPWGVMLVIAPIAGFGLGTLEAVIGSLVIGASGKKANTAMSRVEIFFGVGALIMPFAGAALIEFSYWKAAFGFVGLLAVIALVLWIIYWPTILDSPVEEEAPAEGVTVNRPLNGRYGIVVLIACALFFAIYVGLEMSFVHYLPSLLVLSNNLTESSATLAISLFWGAMVIGRMAAGQIADRWGGGAYLLVTCIITAVLFSLMSLRSGTLDTFVLTTIAGLMMSGMFAIALVFANRAMPGMTEKTTSLLIGFGAIGGALLPKLAGWFMDEYGPDSTRWLFAGIALVMLLLIACAILLQRQSARTAAFPSK